MDVNNPITEKLLGKVLEYIKAYYPSGVKKDDIIDYITDGGFYSRQQVEDHLQVLVAEKAVTFLPLSKTYRFNDERG